MITAILITTGIAGSLGFFLGALFSTAVRQSAIQESYQDGYTDGLLAASPPVKINPTAKTVILEPRPSCLPKSN